MKRVDYYEVGQRIRKCREDLGITQKAASKLCGISQSFYGNIESGNKIMSLETFYSICDAFDVSADYLLYDGSLQSDEIILNILSEVKNKNGSIQYEKYLKIIKALAYGTEYL